MLVVCLHVVSKGMKRYKFLYSDFDPRYFDG